MWSKDVYTVTPHHQLYSRACKTLSYRIVHYFVLFLCVASWIARSNNFIVGLTNVNPEVSRPTLWNYTLCGQYPGAVPAGATVSLYCQDNLPPFRYVIVQFPRTDNMNFCELEVLVVGMKILWIFYYCIIPNFFLFLSDELSARPANL